MFFKKTRNLAVTALAFIMAITLGFGLLGFKTEVHASASDAYIKITAGTTTGQVGNGADVSWNKTNADVTSNDDGSTQYVWSFDAMKNKNYKTFLEVPGLGHGKVAWKCSSSNTQRFLYFQQYKDGAFTQDDSRKIAMDSSTDYLTKAVAEFTAEDIYEEAGAYYLVFYTKDDFKANAATVVFTPDKKIQYTVNKVEFVDKAEEYFVLEGTVQNEIAEKVSPSLPTAINITGAADDASTETVTVNIDDWTFVQGEGVWTATPVLKDTDVPENYTWEKTTYPVPTLTITVKPDERPTVASLDDVTVIIDQYMNYTLPTTLSGKDANGGDAQNVSVTWDKAADTTTDGIKTYTATAVESNTYKVSEGVTATLTLKVRKVYASPFDATWDITEVDDGAAWDGTGDSTSGIKNDHLLKEAMGIEIYAAAGTYSDNKSNPTDSPITQISAMDNCVKANKNTDLFKIAVPENFHGTITIKASPFNYSNGKRFATLELIKGGETLQTVSSYDASNSGKTNFNATAGSISGGDLTDENVMQNQYDFVFSITEGGTYTIKNVAGEHGGDTTYASSVVVDGKLQATKRFFYEGEKLPEINNLYGYEFIGWADADNPTGILPANTQVKADGDYFVLLAKVEYLGVSFRTESFAGVRYGFILKFYDHDDREEAVNSLKTETIKKLQISLSSVEFNLTADKQDTTGILNGKVTLTKDVDLNYGYSDEKHGYVANLVLTGIDATKHANWKIKVDATFKMNVGETEEQFTANGEEAVIKEKAQLAYNDGAFGNKEDQTAKDVAAWYGVTA